MAAVEVPLFGKHAVGRKLLVDSEDLAFTLQYNWFAALCPDGQTGTHEKYYARRKGKNNETIYLHRELMRCPPGMIVDHLNDDGLDCRRSNMKITTQRRNATRGKRKKEEPNL